MNMLDKKLIEELENLSLNRAVEAQNIPTLQPPPASVKLRKSNDLSPKNTNLLAATLPKVQKTDFNTLNRNSYEAAGDTAQVVNRIWFETNVKQNGSSSTNIATIQTEFGQFKCNQPEQVYRNSVSNLQQSSYSNGENTHLYNNQSVLMQNTPVYSNGISSSYNLYSPQTYDPYSLSNNRQYSEVAESVYSEIPEYLYSQVPDETLKPHRPAPPSPLVIVGQPQSMQQIQRKMQVIYFFIL